MFPEVKLHFDRELRLLLFKRSGRESGDVVLSRRAPLKDLVESSGVPHTEVGTCEWQGKPLGFGYVPDGGEDICILAPEIPVDVTLGSFLRPAPLKTVRFLVDCNVERLGRLLRVSGLDVGLSGGDSDRRLALRAMGDGRVLLTRDRFLLMRKAVTWGRLIRSENPWDQLGEVVRFFGLRSRLKPFTRCPACNGLLAEIPKEAVWEKLEPLTRRYYRVFRRCSDCGKIYWRGSHCDRFRSRLEKMGLLDR